MFPEIINYFKYIYPCFDQVLINPWKHITVFFGSELTVKKITWYIFMCCRDHCSVSGAAVLKTENMQK